MKMRLGDLEFYTTNNKATNYHIDYFIVAMNGEFTYNNTGMDVHALRFCLIVLCDRPLQKVLALSLPFLPV